ncbi:MAG: hypothetical protein AB7N76_31245 [Planctomycetota bacterium]
MDAPRVALPPAARAALLRGLARAALVVAPLALLVWRAGTLGDALSVLVGGGVTFVALSLLESACQRRWAERPPSPLAIPRALAVAWLVAGAGLAFVPAQACYLRGMVGAGDPLHALSEAVGAVGELLLSPFGPALVLGVTLPVAGVHVLGRARGTKLLDEYAHVALWGAGAYALVACLGYSLEDLRGGAPPSSLLFIPPLWVIAWVGSLIPASFLAWALGTVELFETRVAPPVGRWD